MSGHVVIVPHHLSEISLVLLVAGMVGYPTIPATRKTKDLSHYDLAFDLLSCKSKMLGLT